MLLYGRGKANYGFIAKLLKVSSVSVMKWMKRVADRLPEPDVVDSIKEVAFPSENPHWFNITIWNSMDVINDYSSEYTIYKCSSESIYGAVILLKEIVSLDDNVVLVPIGTRPHSMACSIFASNRAGVRIIHDYAIENEKRSEGIANINIYHLTNFIEI